MFSNEEHWHGSARIADGGDLARARLFHKTHSSVMPGFFEGKPLFIGGQGGVLTCAGARSGKLKDILAYNVCWPCFGSHKIVLDVKGEIYAISQNQTAENRHIHCWNPKGEFGPQDRINPVSYIRIDSPAVVSHTKVFAENSLPLTGSANAQYFEMRGQEVIEAFSLTIAERDGVLTLPALHEAINLAVSPSDAWLDFAFLMHESRFPIAKRIEKEIAEFHKAQSDGMRGILGEVFKAFQALSDPLLMASVSPPFTFDFEWLTRKDRLYNIYLMPPAEFLEAWAPVIKAIFVSAMVYKAANTQAPPQLWILDEAGHLGSFPLIVKMFTYGAGIDIRPWVFVQSVKQLRNLGPNAETILLSSAATRQFFGIRDIETASFVSRMCGSETLIYDDPHHKERAYFKKQEAMQALLAGEDPLHAALAFAAARRSQHIPMRQHRELRTPAEILNMPGDKQFLFTDAVDAPIYADRKAYFDQAFMAGRYHPNPYHPPPDRVRVRTGFGREWRRVIEAPVPDRFAHLPQYRDGIWSYIRGAA